MLTSDLVRVRRRGGQISIVRLSDASRRAALDLGARYLALARVSVGRTRGELDEAWAAVPVEVRDRKLAAGLRKLILDACEFEVEDGFDPAALRRAVFSRAAEARRRLAPGEPFDRAAVLAAVAAEAGDPASGAGGPGEPGAGGPGGPGGAAEIDRRLFADLRGAHRLLGWTAIGPDGLLARYELGQIQAVLLRAARVEVEVRGAPGAYRALFRKLKFLQLLHVLEARPEGGYRIAIDGPFSLFRSVTRYGARLAMLVPALEACEHWSLRADVLWGVDRKRSQFAVDCHWGGSRGRAPARVSAERTGDPAAGDAVGARAAGGVGRLPDDVAALIDRFRERDGAWQAAPATDILDLPGVGLCVPDLAFTHRDTGECVFLEILGYWSREAVWRRVELVEAGLPYKIVFAVSSRLRVSEEVLPGELPGALYVYKGVMSARQIEERLDRLAAR